jgi:hypothetical protein
MASKKRKCEVDIVPRESALAFARLKQKDPAARTDQDWDELVRLLEAGPVETTPRVS